MNSKNESQQNKKIKKPNNFFYDFIKVTGLPSAWLFLRPKVYFAEKTRSNKIKGRALIVANHISFTDPITVLLVFWRRRLRLLATKDLFRNKPMKFFFKNCCHGIEVDKENFSLATLNETLNALRTEQAVMIFPEGKVNASSEELLPFKKGAAMMAYKGDSPMIPMYIAPRRSIWKRQVVVLGDAFRAKDVVGENSSYRDLKKISAYLHAKETELMEYYRKHYDEKGNKRKSIEASDNKEKTV